MAQARTIAGGAPTQSTAQVSADQETVFGNGTTSDPLRTSGVATYSAPAEASVHTGLGMAVLADQPVGALQFTRSNAASVLTAHVTGLVVKLTPNVANPFGPATVKEQGTGIVDQTTVDWDLITGETGGLTIAAVYYLSDASSGFITKIKPVTSGHFVTQIGYGLSPTEMQLQIGVPVLIP